jgi:hypothetical protein
MTRRIDDKELFIFDFSLHPTKASFKMLDPNNFCNDEIILYGVKRMFQNMNPAEVHVFDPLTLRNNLNHIKSESLDSLNKQIIVYPFNIDKSHWVTYGKNTSFDIYLFYLSIMNVTILYLLSAVLNVLNILDQQCENSKPCIILIDSDEPSRKLGINIEVARLIRRWLLIFEIVCSIIF